MGSEKEIMVILLNTCKGEMRLFCCIMHIGALGETPTSLGRKRDVVSIVHAPFGLILNLCIIWK